MLARLITAIHRAESRASPRERFVGRILGYGRVVISGTGGRLTETPPLDHPDRGVDGAEACGHAPGFTSAVWRLLKRGTWAWPPCADLIHCTVGVTGSPPSAQLPSSETVHDEGSATNARTLIAVSPRRPQAKKATARQTLAR